MGGGETEVREGEGRVGRKAWKGRRGGREAGREGGGGGRGKEDKLENCFLSS